MLLAAERTGLGKGLKKEIYIYIKAVKVNMLITH